MNGEIFLWLIGLIIAIIIGAWLLNLFYISAPKDRALVRTGLGGERVILNGGAIVLPFVHTLTPVNLNLVRTAIAAQESRAMVTKDRIRVDVESEFFFRVSLNPEAVSISASALGSLTNRPEELATFFESEFLGALRSVASERTLMELHEGRQSFVDDVRQRATVALGKFGLELDTVAIRNLDQTALEHFNPANRFDAEGMTQLIEGVEERRRLRNEIEQRAIVAIRAANLSSEKETLELERESHLARLNQEREIEAHRASQTAEIAREQSTKEAAANAARIEAEQSTKQREIAANEEVERARISADRALSESRLLRDQELRQLEIERAQEVELARINSNMLLLSKAAEEAEVKIDAQDKLTKAVQAEESIATVRETEIADRDAAVAKVVAEKDAAIEKLLSEVRAEAERLQNEAENVLTEDARLGRLRAQLIEKLEVIVRESVKPIEKIDGIKMVHVSGGGNGDVSKSPTDEVIDSVMRYRVQAPLVDELMRDIGMDGSKIGSADRLLGDAKDIQTIQRAAEAGKKDQSK